MFKINNKNAFSIIELMLLVLLIVVLIVMCYPLTNKILLSQKELDIREKVATATDGYINGYFGTKTDNTCYNISYDLLITKGYLIKPKDLYCSGYVQVKKDSTGDYKYKYYLNCNSQTETITNDVKKLPSGCTTLENDLQNK